MARKKRDFDYMELYNPDYRTMKANIFDGIVRDSHIETLSVPDKPMTNPFGQESAYNGAYKMNKLSRNDFDYQNMTPEAQQQFDAYNQQVKDNNQQYRQNKREARQEARQQEGGGFGMWGNVINGAANNMITAFTDPNMKVGDRVATILGMPNLAKNWRADTTKGDANITEMTNRINNATNRLIQDSNDTQGAFAAIKNNNNLNLIDTSGFKTPTLKDFKGKWWKNTGVAMAQGAASGSIGGPWGAAGGAAVGLLGSIGGLFGRKGRAERALEKYKNDMNYLQRFAGNFNSFQRLNQQQSNENLLNNGLKQQRIQDLANIRAYGGNLFEDGGETPPPYYPESQDSTAIQWLSDWYRQRPEQLKNTFYGSTYEMPNPNISGEYEDLNEIPQERILSPTNRMFGDDLYKNLIDRAATASTIYRMDMPPSTLGEYSPAGRGILTENGPVDKPNAAHTISFNMRDVPAFANPEEEYYDEETLPLRVHEYNHPITHGFESLADSINSKAKRKEGVKYDEYDDNPYEIHSYMMEFRQRAGLDPTEKVTKDVLDKHRTELKKSNLDRFTDDSLIDMLNNVVDNSTNNYNNIAAMGGQFDFNLSPNMIDLQNQSLANQKYKYINQIQPVGFVDSGHGKIPNPGIPRLACGGKLHLNKFDFGGSMNGMDIPTGMQSYENGGTHEENPNGGIQVGVDSQGTPNLVEEGEFRWGDYVFSNRIDVDLDVLSDFNVPATKRQGKKANKGKLSYADLAKKMAKKAGDLNDPITKDTLNENMKRASQAQDFQKARMNSDNQLADYKNALKNQTQGNPMYGSMKYNGMGNVNQGLNEGSSAMEGVDNSSLSNVNRSGNEMMAAYGGNLFANGGRRRRNTVDLGYGQDYIPDLSDYKNAYYGNWGNNYAINSGVYDNGPHNATDLAGTEYAYLTNRINDSLPTYQQNVYIPNEYGQGLNYAGTVPMTDYGTIMQTRKLVEPEPEIIRQTNPMQIPVEISTMRPINFGTTQNNTSTNTSSPTNGSSYSSESYKYSTQTPQRTGLEDYTDPLTPAESTQEGLPNSKDQAGIVDNRNLDEKHAQFATATTPTVPTLNTAGLYAQLGKGLTKNIYNWAGLANTEFKPNYKPEQDLRALGKTGYVPRTADHSGMYRAADLYDINLANNAAQAQAAATARAMSNVNDRNQRAANQLAADYNAALGVGNNYQTMFDANMKSRLATDEYNKQTEQTNVAANNDMYRDNQNAGIQAKNFELSANTAANQMQWAKNQYADTQNRIAALNKQSDAARMADNQINFLVDKAKENAYYNLKNKDPRQMYWNDPSTGEWHFKGDNGYYNNLRRAMSGTGINSLDTTSNEELAAMADQKGWNNITEEDMKDIIARQYEREDKAKKDKEAKDAQDLRNAKNQYMSRLLDIQRFDPDYKPDYSSYATADDWLTGYNRLNTDYLRNEDYWKNMQLYDKQIELAKLQAKAYGGKIKTNKRNKNHSYDYMAI